VVVLWVVVVGLGMVTSWACVHGDGCDGGVDVRRIFRPRGYDETCRLAAGDGVNGTEIDLPVILSWGSKDRGGKVDI